MAKRNPVLSFLYVFIYSLRYASFGSAQDKQDRQGRR